MPDTTTVDTSAPIGAVVAFAGPAQNVPGNWAVCDGRAMDKNQFSDLFNRIGTSWGGDGSPRFFLPDLRGAFLRGVDRAQDGTEPSTRNDPDRETRFGFSPPSDPTNIGNAKNAVGSFQRGATRLPFTPFKTDVTGNHSHLDPTWNGQAGPFELATLNRGPGGHDYIPSAPTSGAGDHSHTVSEGGDSETRPYNAYVYYIIRVK